MNQLAAIPSNARRLFLAAMMLLCVVAHASAETSAAFYGGYSAPAGETRKGLGDGYHFGFSLTRADETRNGVELNAAFHMFATKTSQISVIGFPLGLVSQANVLEAAVLARIAIPPKASRVSPYLKMGFGFDQVFSDFTIIGPSGSVQGNGSKLWMGLQGGVGVSMRTGDKTSLRLESVFHEIESDNEPTQFITVSLAISSAYP